MKHISVLLQESISSLNLKENSIVVDATLGYGGHSSNILERVNKGYLFAFDQDSEAIRYSTDRLNKIGTNFTIIKSNFVNLKEELEKAGAQITIFEDEIVIKKLKPTAPKVPFSSHNDHRIVMALSLFATLFDIEIDECEAIDKSFPLYFEYLSRLGMEVDYELPQEE